MYFLNDDPPKLYFVEREKIKIVARIQLLENDDIVVLNNSCIHVFNGTFDECCDFIYGLGGLLGAANVAGATDG